LVALKIDARELARHPLVELCVGKFAAQKVIDVFIVLDLLFLDFDFFLSNLDLDLGTGDFLVPKLSLGIPVRQALAWQIGVTK